VRPSRKGSRPLAILDIDGVLVDTLAANIEAYQYACGRMGLPVPGVDQIRSLMGLRAEEMAVALGCSPGEARDFMERYAWPRYEAVVAEGVPTFPGVPDVLAALADRGVRLTAWTSDRAALQEVVLSRAGIRGWIEYLHAPGESEHPKPDPRGLEEIVARFPGAAPRYLIDDRGEMLSGANRIRARRIFAAYGLGVPPLRPPDGVLRTPLDLLALILPPNS